MKLFTYKTQKKKSNLFSCEILYLLHVYVPYIKRARESIKVVAQVPYQM